MAIADLSDWLKDQTDPDSVWYIKRLSGNDTLANGSHQAGPYIAREFLFQIFPSINRTDVKNPDTYFDLYIDSHADHRKVRAVYYNNKFHGNPAGGRNEARLTNFGGQNSALLDPDSTGALSVFSFRLDSSGACTDCNVWVCQHETEEELVEELVGQIDPGKYLIWWPARVAAPQLSFSEPRSTGGWLSTAHMPRDWLFSFPSAAEIVRKTVELRPLQGLSPDQRLLKRRECEAELFRSIEHALEVPYTSENVINQDDLAARALTILERRKKQAGQTLQLHAREIFIEERLVEGINFSHQSESEMGKRPDFLFPSQAAYQNPSFPAGRLRMLAVRITCRDRWRQIIGEADRIPSKHLLTLQEGVSESQFREMTEAGMQLVIPSRLIGYFPTSVQPHLQTLESFIGDVRLLTV